MSGGVEETVSVALLGGLFQILVLESMEALANKLVAERKFPNSSCRGRLFANFGKSVQGSGIVCQVRWAFSIATKASCITKAIKAFATLSRKFYRLHQFCLPLTLTKLKQPLKFRLLRRYVC